MNILYIEHYAGSPEMGMEFRPYYLAKEWMKMGHNVRIAAGDYSHLRVRNPKVETDFQEEVIDGLTYSWIKTGYYEGNGAARALSMFRFVRKLRARAKWIAEKWKPDVIITSSTYPLDTFAGQKIRKQTRQHGAKGAVLIHEVHDMWPATLYEVGGMSRKNPFVILMQIAENSAYKHCDKCVSLLPYAKDYMTQHGLQPEKFINIQNGVVAEEWEKAQEIPEEHRSFFEQHAGQFVVGYFGGHALSNALDRGLDAAKSFMSENKDVIFVFVGDGTEKARLVRRAEDEAITNVFFLPPVPKKSIPDLLSHFDCSFMTGMPSPLYRFGLSLNKMYDSMMAAVPIVCAFDAPDSPVKIYHCGYQCSVSKEDTIAAIKRLTELSPEERKQMGQNGRQAVLEHFTYEKLAKQFAGVF